MNVSEATLKLPVTVELAQRAVPLSRLRLSSVNVVEADQLSPEVRGKRSGRGWLIVCVAEVLPQEGGKPTKQKEKRSVKRKRARFEMRNQASPTCAGVVPDALAKIIVLYVSNDAPCHAISSVPTTSYFTVARGGNGNASPYVEYTQ